MMGPIGYYVHHHGDGHRQRALAIAAALGDRMVLLGTGLAGRTGAVRAIDLPDDKMADDGFAGDDGETDRPQSLHYAPTYHSGIRERVAILTDWIERERPALLVVDVSVEIAMLARLAATPTVYVRLAGRRHDLAHLEAFRAATAILSPFDKALDDPRTPHWVCAKTAYVPGLTAWHAAPVNEAPGDDILVILGAGGTAIQPEQLAAAARATPSHLWRIAGRIAPPVNCPDNLRLLGWVDDIGREIARAGIVIGGGGDGVVSAVLAAGQPFLCLPEARPFDEQLIKARLLAASGAAIVRESWPAAGQWPSILAEAFALAPDGASGMHDADGSERAAAFLRAAAEH